jgi:ribonuclease T1
MKIKLFTKFAIVLISTPLFAFNVAAKNIEQCGKRGPSQSTGELDNFRDAKVNAVQGTRLVVFNNNERRLPKAGRNETYYEFDLGRDGFGGRGAHRAVILVQEGSKNKILKSYFTQDHYATFCAI